MTIHVKGIRANELLRYLPHRHPFLFVDRIEELHVNIKNIPESYIIGTKAISISAPYLQGHFPKNPIMPGVLLLEGAMQASCVGFDAFYRDFTGSSYEGDFLPMVVSINNVRFKKPVVPGDIVKYRIGYQSIRRGFVKIRAKITVGDDLCSQFDFTVHAEALKGALG